jgi:hypothetical protein
LIHKLQLVLVLLLPLLLLLLLFYYFTVTVALKHDISFPCSQGPAAGSSHEADVTLRLYSFNIHSILSSHLPPDIFRNSHPRAFLSEVIIIYLSSHACYMPCPSHNPSLIILLMCCGVWNSRPQLRNFLPRLFIYFPCFFNSDRWWYLLHFVSVRPSYTFFYVHFSSNLLSVITCNWPICCCQLNEWIEYFICL